MLNRLLNGHAWLIVSVAMMTACSDQSAVDNHPVSGNSAITQSSSPPNENDHAANLDDWLGQWNGPEGTFILLSKATTGYDITIQSLDGPAKYLGRAVSDHIEFERNGKTESIRATNGQTTGMKWLLDKKNCLTIHTGEGFCRD